MGRKAKERTAGGVLPDSFSALAVQNPAPGAFDTKDLLWTALPTHGAPTHCGTAVIPATRVDDFLLGWGAEVGTNLPVQCKNWNVADRALRTEFMCQRATT